LQQQFVEIYAQTSTASAANDQQVMHVVNGATGVIQSFGAGNVVAATSTGAITVDLLKNGTTILTATYTLNSTSTAYTLVAPAGFTSTAVVVGDVLEIKLSGTTAGGGAKPIGVFARLVIREDPQ
jgi:hypothetical protein